MHDSTSDVVNVYKVLKNAATEEGKIMVNLEIIVETWSDDILWNKCSTTNKETTMIW